MDAPNRFFRGVRCVFLPLKGKDHGKLIRGFRGRGGTEQFCCTDDTNFVVADSWDEVYEHFLKYPRLMCYFEEHGVRWVSYTWLYMSLEYSRVFPPGRYELSYVVESDEEGELKENVQPVTNQETSQECGSPEYVRPPLSLPDENYRYQGHCAELLHAFEGAKLAAAMQRARNRHLRKKAVDKRREDLWNSPTADHSWNSESEADRELD